MTKYIEKILKLRQRVSVKHHIPGRIRLKYKLSIIAQIGMFSESKLDKLLSNFPAIKKYSVNVGTCSVLIEYDNQIITPRLIDDLFAESDAQAEKACFEIANILQIEEMNE